MASNNAILSWNAATEPDYSNHIVYWGLYSGLYTSQLNVVGTGTTLSSGSFNSDGLWSFTVSAKDTSNNESAKATPVTKRIIRTASQFIVRR